MGGGFIEFLFNGGQSPDQRYDRQPEQRSRRELPPMDPQEAMRPREESIEPGRPGIDPKFEKQVVSYDGNHAPGTLVIDTPNKFLYLVQAHGKALRYGIGVGIYLVRRKTDFDEEGVAGLDAAGGNAQAPTRFAASYGRRA